MKKKRLSERAADTITRCNPVEFATLSVTILAKKLGVTIPHLSRAFKNDRGYTLKEYLVRGKIARSQFLLLNNQKLKVKEAAALLHFCSTDYFIKVFRRYIGMPPGKYREMYSSASNSGEIYRGSEKRIVINDRRIGPKDRRKENIPVNIERRNFFFNGGDRRIGPADRRRIAY
ncbi:MAG: helix-turn-helix transcriptional regulator [Candidatus Aminicenantes bacterium]|nr:helix-turn-helix transcriptional regulator [Candidatus Aminicenantes bacterium]